jgi:hypothetical protein
LPSVGARVSGDANVLESAVPEILERNYRFAILATVHNETDWSRVAPVVSSYARALAADDDVVFAIGALGELDAQTLGKRVERAMVKAGVDPARSPDIDVSDVRDAQTWLTRFSSARCFSAHSSPELNGIEPMGERSRSGIARFVRGLNLK